MSGVNGLNKPAGPSSASVVARVKRLLGKSTKIGHAGTLDPFATGVLLLLVGQATKLCETLMDQPKQYEATVRFGSTTVTDDPDSEQIPWPRTTTEATPPSLASLQSVMNEFLGITLQRPPTYSAIKVRGRRAYQLARQGKPQVLPARPVNVHAIHMIDYSWPDLRLRIDCGRGTYIRSLARDIGARLDVGAHLTELRRTRVGQFWIESAVTISDLSANSLSDSITSVEEVQGQITTAAARL